MKFNQFKFKMSFSPLQKKNEDHFAGTTICDHVAVSEHFFKKIETIEIIEPNNGDPYIINLDCLMYFPKAKVNLLLLYSINPFNLLLLFDKLCQSMIIVQ